MVQAGLDPGQVVFSGPLIVAALLAAAAGAVSFLSPCCLPLVPGFLALTSGAVGADVASTAGTQKRRADRSTVMTARSVGSTVGRAAVGSLLFIAGFASVFVAFGAAFGGLGVLMGEYQRLLVKILGALTIVLGLLFAGWLPSVPWLSRTVRISHRPRAGLVGAPAVGMLFGLGWTPCIGPTLAAVLTLSLDQASAWRGALLGLFYSLGLGIPFLLAAVLFARGMAGFGWARRHAWVVMRAGGVMLVVIGVLQVSGAWNLVIDHLRGWVSGYSTWL